MKKILLFAFVIILTSCTKVEKPKEVYKTPINKFSFHVKQNNSATKILVDIVVEYDGMNRFYLSKIIKGEINKTFESPRGKVKRVYIQGAVFNGNGNFEITVFKNKTVLTILYGKLNKKIYYKWHS